LEGYGAAEEGDQAEGERSEPLFYRSAQLRLFSRPRGEAGSRSDLGSHCEFILAKYPIAQSVRFLNLMTKPAYASYANITIVVTCIAMSYN